MLAAVAVAAAAGAWFAARSYQQDFAAYLTAGLARTWNLDPYLNYAGQSGDLALPWDGVAVFRHSRFLYPPLVADLFRPLLAVPFLAAKSLFTAAMLAAWIGAGVALADDRRGRTIFFAATALFFPFYRHLERGQIDLLILLLLAIAWRTRGRPWIAGAALAATVAFKPAFVGLWPVVWASGRARTALAALAVGAGIVGLTAAVDGPGRLREYVAEVLSRAALYGEGGTEEMLLPAARLPAAADDGTMHVGGRSYRTSIGEAPAAASVPRLLAPESPTPASARLPFVVGIGVLTLLAQRLRRVGDADVEALLFWAAALTCVITSPAGWVMGLVLALPLAPLGAALQIEGRLGRGPAAAGVIAWTALAVPQPFAGWAAVAGVTLVAAASAAAATLRREAVST
ncbi:MAG TPA: glycosyltransferase 87 family protein [Polyangia bacterium]